MMLTMPALKDSEYLVLIFDKPYEARRFIGHFITRGYWFSHQRKEGEIYICISSSHDLTPLSNRFKFTWEGALQP